MPDPKAVQAQRQLIRLEDGTAQQVVRAYERAQREMIQELLTRMTRLGSSPTPEQIRSLARDATLLRDIEARLDELAREHRVILRAGLAESQEIGLGQVTREIERLVRALGVEIPPAVGIDPGQLGLIPNLVHQAEQFGDQYKALLTNELLTSLIRGDPFDQIVIRVLAVDPGPEAISLARKGRNEAELNIRRWVIEANNGSRQAVYERAREDIPGLKKQLVAVIQPDRTTETCLKAHGQIREIDEPYRLTGKPRFAREMMYPPFHWRCRSSSVAYHPRFEEHSRMTTEAMREAAQKALKEKENG